MWVTVWPLRPWMEYRYCFGYSAICNRLFEYSDVMNAVFFITSNHFAVSFKRTSRNRMWSSLVKGRESYSVIFRWVCFIQKCFKISNWKVRVCDAFLDIGRTDMRNLRADVFIIIGITAIWYIKLSFTVMPKHRAVAKFTHYIPVCCCFLSVE